MLDDLAGSHAADATPQAQRTASRTIASLCPTHLARDCIARRSAPRTVATGATHIRQNSAPIGAVLSMSALMLACPSSPPPPERAAESAQTPTTKAPSSQPAHAASQPKSADKHGQSDDFKVPELQPLPPLTGPAAQLQPWSSQGAPRACTVKMREVRDELTNGQVAAAHQMLVTYDVIAKPGDTTTT
ncbi:MAG: hypothetical protein AAFV29_07925, partial [Myxococcota bacterium]